MSANAELNGVMGSKRRSAATDKQLEPNAAMPGLPTRAEVLAGLGKRLSRAIERESLTQAGVADRIGVERGVLWTWTSGRSWPSPEGLVRLSLVLGVSLDWLLKGPRPRKRKPKEP